MSDPTTPVAWGIQLAKLWLASGQGFPVNVAALALEVTRQRFSEPIGIVVPHGIDGLDGLLSKREKHKDWCISYDEKLTVPGRINLTVAHEFGHYLLHRNLRDGFRCGQAEMMDYDSLDSKRLEAQANAFASYLLMPRNDFDAQIKGQEISFELLGHCAERYQTSLTAAALKWLEFTEEAATLVVADHEGLICWSYPSQSARRLGAVKTSGEKIPLSALQYFRASTADARKDRRVGRGVWHPTEEAIESAIVSDQFKQLIFLIRFPFAYSPEHVEGQDPDSFTVLSEKAQRLRRNRN
ncbi:MAG: ImmA/IrrE family metallo-endopeptidase [Pseudomonadota bacterium]